MFLNKLGREMVNFIQNNEQNYVTEFNMLQLYDQPLIGVADASDPYWEKFKQPDIVGPSHLTPNEWLPNAKSVISYFLPFTEQIRKSNRLNDDPSKEWMYGRYEGEEVNNALKRLIVQLVKSENGEALIPTLDKRFRVEGHRSNWSERHAAFIAGIGTFSLSCSLITSRGTAGRFGSVIVDLELEPKTRTYKEFDEYCIKCGKCIKRCPIQAITEDNKDKESCAEYLNKIFELNKPRYGCGKCQTAVPCEYVSPSSRLK